ncbi:vanin-like protein 1 [Anastrepha ludens]|uniref:vanin-like protein 1 n=1 Tax=Anastrepha ludens TaxID=28586 RepID=UPI0023AFDBC3|nr:vanin-like protein 1 [Anastrepha ludens]
MLQSVFKQTVTLNLFFVCTFLLLYPTNQRPLTVSAAAVAASIATANNSSYYTAGVVEFRPARNAVNSLEDNLAGYVEIISSSAAEPTDIIVFPESTLNSATTSTFVPDPDSAVDTIPCLLGNTSVYSDFLVQLSCSARQARKYVVVNLTERDNCTTSQQDPRPCASSGLNTFNTNVVFDREGRVISRYRKWNLYGEPKNTTYNLELGIFETDFGVRFGHFICFDILFYKPTQSLVDLGIRDFIYPTMWFSQLPFLTGVQFQQSWSYINDVNFLAAGASLPAIGSTGSGIYAGRKGPLVSVMNTGDGERHLYVAQVPKLSENPQRAQAVKEQRTITPAPRLTHLNQSDILLKRDYLDQYESVLVDLTNATGRLVTDVCYKEFCCHFELQWQQLGSTVGQYYNYRLGAYEGMRDEPGAEGTNALRNCAIFTCTGTNIADCGKLFAANVTQQPQVAFERIVIEGDFEMGYPALLMPNSLRDDLLPLDMDDFEWGESDNAAGSRHVRYTLNTTTSNLLAFAIYSNFYDGTGFIEQSTSSSQATTVDPTTTTDPNAGGGVGALLQSNLLMWLVVGLLSVVLK